MHPYLTASNLAYSLPDGGALFQHVDVALGAERVGLVGANGTGKSTLLRILAGGLDASGGNCVRSGAVAYLAQQHMAAPDTTVAEQLDNSGRIAAYQRMLAGTATPEDLAALEDAWERIGRLDALRDQLGISHVALDRPMSSLSGGERTRVMLAALLLPSPDALLLDEPTNHLDAEARAIVHRVVREWPKGLIVASHDRRLLGEVDRIVELTPEGLRSYGGNYAFYRAQRDQEQAGALAALESAQQRKKVARVQAHAIAERQAHRNAEGRKRAPSLGMPRIALGGMKRRAQGTTAKLSARHAERMEAAAAGVETAREAVRPDARIVMDLHGSAARSGKQLAELHRVNHRFAVEGPWLWPEPLDLQLFATDRVAVRGLNGSGKSTLLAMLRGVLQPAVGRVTLHTGRIGYLDQDVALLNRGHTALENLRAVAPLRSEHEARILLGRFGLEGDAVHKRVTWLSGGERMRVGLACLLCADQAPELLILDEPTNNLDLVTQEALTSALRNYRGGLVLVSHDPDVLEDAGIERSVDLRRAETS